MTGTQLNSWEDMYDVHQTAEPPATSYDSTVEEFFDDMPFDAMYEYVTESLKADARPLGSWNSRQLLDLVSNPEDSENIPT